MVNWFTADTHFSHTNIMKYVNRPFDNVDEMNETLIQNWNTLVGKNDRVYHLGDFGFGESHKLFEILKRLNGIIYFIEGNHDKSTRKIKDNFAGYYYQYREIEIGDLPITLCHYAMRVWNKSHYGAWHLYGHSHGSLPDDPNALSLDVGVDCWGYRPVSFDEIAAKMSTKHFVPVDHHGANRNG